MNKTIAYLSFIILFTCVLASCKSDPKPERNSTLSDKELSIISDSIKLVEQAKQNGQDVDAQMISQKLRGQNEDGATIATRTDVLPTVCELLKAKLVADEFDVREADILVTDGHRKKGGTNSNKSCFWRWTGGGVLVQISRNPLPDEIPNWTEKYISSKRAGGERNIEDGKTVKYDFKDFDGPGSDNLYNHELGRYYSVYKEKFVVAIIFNYNQEERKQKKVANTLLKNVFESLQTAKK